MCFFLLRFFCFVFLFVSDWPGAPQVRVAENPVCMMICAVPDLATGARCSVRLSSALHPKLSILLWIHKACIHQHRICLRLVFFVSALLIVLRCCDENVERSAQPECAPPKGARGYAPGGMWAAWRRSVCRQISQSFAVGLGLEGCSQPAYLLSRVSLNTYTLRTALLSVRANTTLIFAVTAVFYGDLSLRSIASSSCFLLSVVESHCLGMKCPPRSACCYSEAVWLPGFNGSLITITCHQSSKGALPPFYKNIIPGNVLLL